MGWARGELSNLFVLLVSFARICILVSRSSHFSYDYERRHFVSLPQRIVEDDAALINALGEKMLGEHFDIVKAKNGEEGLAAALHDHPDLILLDLDMPVMDGMTMLRELRKDDWGKSAPVIILTNIADIADVALAVQNSTYEYLLKADWKLEDVIKKIKDKLGIA